MEKLAFSIDEATEVLPVSRDLINDLIRTGRLRSVKVGRRRIIPADAIYDFLHPDEKGSGQEESSG